MDLVLMDVLVDTQRVLGLVRLAAGGAEVGVGVAGVCLHVVPHVVLVPVRLAADAAAPHPAAEAHPGRGLGVRGHRGPQVCLPVPANSLVVVAAEAARNLETGVVRDGLCVL